MERPRGGTAAADLEHTERMLIKAAADRWGEVAEFLAGSV